MEIRNRAEIFGSRIGAQLEERELAWESIVAALDEVEGDEIAPPTKTRRSGTPVELAFPAQHRPGANSNCEWNGTGQNQLDNRTFYALHFTVASDRLQNLRDQMDSIAQSFRLK